MTYLTIEQVMNLTREGAHEKFWEDPLSQDLFTEQDFERALREAAEKVCEAWNARNSLQSQLKTAELTPLR